MTNKPNTALYKLTLVVLIALLTSPILGEDLNLSIEIRQGGTGRPIKRVEVRLGDQIGYSDGNGKIVLNYQKSSQTVMFVKDGFETQFATVESLKEDSILYMLPGAPDDNEVIVRGSRRPEPSRKIITTKETTRIAPGGDPAQITKLLPGVQVENNFNNEVIIRGSGPNDSRYYVDDLRVANIFHSVANLSVIPDQIIDQVDFSSGGFGAQYGEATGGVVVLRSKSDIPEYAENEARLNVPFYTSLYRRAPIDEDSSYTVSLRGSLTQFFIPAFLESMDEDDQGLTAVPYFTDALIRHYKRGDSMSSKTTFIYSVDGVTAAFPADSFVDEQGKAEISFEQSFAVLGQERSYRLSKGTRLKTTPQIYYQTIGFDLSPIEFELDFYTLSAPTEWSKRLGKGRFIYVGAEPEYTIASVKSFGPQFQSDDPFYDPEDAEFIETSQSLNTFNGAFWLASDYLIGDSLTVSPGLRFFYSGFIKETIMDPRLSLTYKWLPQLNLKGAVGLYSQTPEPQEAAEEVGNPDLTFETARHYILGIFGDLDERWSYDLQVFHKMVKNKVRSDPATKFNNQGALRVNGAEVFLRRNLTEKFFGWLAYTYSVAEERASPSDPYYTSAIDTTHILNLAASYKITAAWDLGSRYKYNSGAPYTEVIGAEYNANTDRFDPLYNAKNPYNKRNPDFDQWDVFASYADFDGEWKLTHRFGIQFITVFDKTSSVTYNYDYSESKTNSSALPPIPFYEIRGEF